MITITERVRFSETDMMGNAHHSNHIRWFECARCAYFDQAGVSLFKLMDDGILFPIKHVACEYIDNIYYNDDISIEARLTKLTRAQMVFSYRILRTKDGHLMAEGMTQNVFTHKETGKVARLADEPYNNLKALYELDQKDADPVQ